MDQALQFELGLWLEGLFHDEMVLHGSLVHDHIVATSSSVEVVSFLRHSGQCLLGFFLGILFFLEGFPVLLNELFLLLLQSGDLVLQFDLNHPGGFYGLLLIEEVLIGKLWVALLWQTHWRCQS